MAERGDVAGKGHLHLPAACAAEERDRHIGDLKARLVRLFFRVPDQWLPLLHAFLEASGIRSDLEDGGPIEHREFAVLRSAVCACAADAAQLARMMSATRRVPLIVIPILSNSPSEMSLQGGLGPLVANFFQHAELSASVRTFNFYVIAGASEISRYYKHGLRV
jgi:hypothetical protein